MGRKKREVQDILLQEKKDRRMLSYVPDKQKARSNVDRRGGRSLEDFEGNVADYIKSIQSGIRYQVDYQVQEAERISLRFEILPGSMPEGYEMTVKIPAKLARAVRTTEGALLCGMVFEKTLAQYEARRKDSYMLTIASVLIFFIVAFIMMMRAESIIYFKFNKWLYLYSIIAAAFLLSRYLFGALYRPVPIDKDYTPGVTIIIPCFNEEEWINRTIIRWKRSGKRSRCWRKRIPIAGSGIAFLISYSRRTREKEMRSARARRWQSMT